MTPAVIDADRDEYDLDSADEADLIALVDAAQGTKRKASCDEISPPTKRLLTTFPCAVAALTKVFGFKLFHLKQEQVKTCSRPCAC
jgi:hypothetical protein